MPERSATKIRPSSETARADGRSSDGERISWPAGGMASETVRPTSAKGRAAADAPLVDETAREIGTDGALSCPNTSRAAIERLCVPSDIRGSGAEQVH